MKHIICIHKKQMAIQTKNLNPGEHGKEYYWCKNCGALTIQNLKRDWLHSLNRGNFKTIYPKLIY